MSRYNRKGEPTDGVVFFNIFTALGWSAAISVAIAALVLSLQQQNAFNTYVQTPIVIPFNGAIRSGFLVGLNNSVIVPENSTVTIPFGIDLAPTPVVPVYFTFNPSTGIGTCNIAGFYKFEIFTELILSNIGADPNGNLVVWITAGSSSSIIRSVISNQTGILNSGNTMVVYAQVNVGQIISVRVLHSVLAPTVVQILQSGCTFRATLIQ